MLQCKLNPLSEQGLIYTRRKSALMIYKDSCNTHPHLFLSIQISKYQMGEQSSGLFKQKGFDHEYVKEIGVNAH